MATRQTFNFTIDDVQALAQTLYGLDGVAAPLPGERDKNFRFETPAGDVYLLKISSGIEDRDILDFENKALAHVAGSAVAEFVPKVHPTRDGQPMGTTSPAPGHTCFVRLLTWLPGTPLAEANPHSPALLSNFGGLLGQLDAALLDFSHRAMHRQLQWDMKHASRIIRQYRTLITDPDQRAIVDYFLRRFDKQVMPILPKLRQSVIHNDGNDYNVLVGPPHPTDRQVTGLVDFGDMVHTYTVFELAIALAYAMLNKPDPLSAAVPLIAGYHAAFPLTELELEHLFTFIAIRLCTSVSISAFNRQENPDNEYLTISEQPAWALLAQLVDIHPRRAHYIFREACGLPPCPQSEKIVAWLKANQADFASILRQPLAERPVHVLDLSVGSTELSDMPNRTDMRALTDVINQSLKSAGATVGIGQYNEARQLYTADRFKEQGPEGDIWRTVHIALDFFAAPGTEVFAPLGGVVHSVKNNTEPLAYGPTVILEHTVPEEGLTFYTLYGHLSEESLARYYPGKPVDRGERIGWVGERIINGGWPSHLHLQLITDLLDQEGNFPGVARPDRRDVWLSLCPNPALLLGLPVDAFTPVCRDAPALQQAREAAIGPSLSVAYQKPLKIVRGQGQFLFDDVGRAYLDCVNNVCHVGHCHPRVTRAGQQQMAVLNTNTRYLHDNLVDYAQMLTATLPDPLSVCFFVCTGSEANELALRLAKTHTGQTDMLVVDHAYHGNSGGLIDISPYKFNGPGGKGAPPHVHTVPMPDVYRGPHKADDPRAGAKYARAVQEAIEAVQAQGRGIAGFIAESLLGCGGQIVLPPNYLQTAYKAVRQAGGVCIADEVQVGFGRVGSHFWGFELQGVVPDIVTMGKPIGNGHPLAAVVTTPQIAASFNNGMEYFNTFGGNPVSCAIGRAVLEVIEAENLQANARDVGAYLLKRLRDLQAEHPLIGDVRGAGLFIGVELVQDSASLAPAAEQAATIIERMKARGVLLSTDGPLHNVLKIKPPIVFSKADADFLVDNLAVVLQEDFLRGR